MNAENSVTAPPELPDPQAVPSEEPRILIVEDNDQLRQSYTRQLERAGYRVVAEERVVAARTRLEDPNEVFEAAVLDYSLPDGDSFELISALLTRSPLCKSLVVTGVGGRDEAKHAVQHGAHAFLEKPVKPTALVAAVMGTVYATLAWRRTAERKGSEESRRETDAEWGAAQAPSPLQLQPDVLMARLRHIAGLTPTETLVTYRLMWGDSDRQIAELLGCAERTAKRHVGHVLRKTGAKTRSGLLGVLLKDAGKGSYWSDPDPEPSPEATTGGPDPKAATKPNQRSESRP